MPSRRTAFTLIESLVTLGILILLLGLLLPMLRGGYAQAQRTACASNLRQIGLGLISYRKDHDGAIPDVQTLPVDKRAPTIMSVLADHVPVADVWRCPADAELFDELGTSYEYFLGFYLAMTEARRLNAETRKYALLKFLEDNPSVAYILSDAEDVHFGGPDGVARQSLFLDGHVDWFLAPGGEKKQDQDEREARVKQAKKTR
jgi:competence protein ComGC